MFEFLSKGKHPFSDIEDRQTINRIKEDMQD